jgi:hypothetical protein
MPKVIEKAIEANNQNMQECCAANKKAVENQIKELKGFLIQELSSIIQEKLDAMEKRLTSGG